MSYRVEPFPCAGPRPTPLRPGPGVAFAAKVRRKSAQATGERRQFRVVSPGAAGLDPCGDRVPVGSGVLAERAGLPPITLHGLRHGAATMLLAAGQPPKVISEVLGHSTVAFTMDVYTEVAEELADAAAAAIAAFIPRRAKTVPNTGADDR